MNMTLNNIMLIIVTDAQGLVQVKKNWVKGLKQRPTDQPHLPWILIRLNLHPANYPKIAVAVAVCTWAWCCWTWRATFNLDGKKT